VTGLAALLVTIAVGLWRGSPARARDRLATSQSHGAVPSRRAAFGRRTGELRRPGDPTALALAIELMAACLEAGVPLPAALDAAATVADAAAAEAFASTAAALRRGGDAAAWASCAADPRLAAVVRICRRSATSGAAVAEELRRLAGELRRTNQAQRRRRAQRASVWVVLPLGLCFLPAFLLLTVVPIVVALLPTLR